MSYTSDSRSDQELVDRAAAGDQRAFEALYHRHRDWVLRAAARFTAPPDDAADVLQNTFLYLVRRLPGLRLTGRLTTLLYPVVKHLAMEVARKHKTERLEDGLTEDLEVAATDRSSARADLRVVLARLPDVQREVVQLRFIDDLSLSEIAEALSVPLGTVKSRLHNAIAALRRDSATRRYFLDEDV